MLSEVRKRFSAPGVSLDELCTALRGPAHSASPKRAKTQEASAGRHVRWLRAADYVCIVRGRDFANAAELDARWRASDISLDDMYIFHHREASRLATRNQFNPLWEALYYLSDCHQFVRVQKCHLRDIYEKAGRTDKALAWTTLNSEPPVAYWVDRHAFSVLKIK